MELQSEKLDELMPEFIQAVSEIGNVPKTKQGYGYKYAELSEVLDFSRPVLSKCNLVITQLVTTIDSEPTLVTTLFHKSGQFLRSCYPLVKAGVKQANDAQQVGAAITYARRYALTAMLFMAQEDDDAASVGSKQSNKQQQQQQQQQQQTKSPEQTLQGFIESVKVAEKKEDVEKYWKAVSKRLADYPELLSTANDHYEARKGDFELMEMN